MLHGTITAFIKVMIAYNDQDKSSDLEWLVLPFTLLLSHYYSIHGICGAPGDHFETMQLTICQYVLCSCLIHYLSGVISRFMKSSNFFCLLIQCMYKCPCVYNCRWLQKYLLYCHTLTWAYFMTCHFTATLLLSLPSILTQWGT